MQALVLSPSCAPRTCTPHYDITDGAGGGGCTSKDYLPPTHNGRVLTAV